MIAVLLIALASCNDNDAPADSRFSTMEIIQKDGPTVQHRLENGRVVETWSKSASATDFMLIMSYVYDAAGLISSIEGVDSREIFRYNAQNELTNANYFLNDELVRAT